MEMLASQLWPEISPVATMKAHKGYLGVGLPAPVQFQNILPLVDSEPLQDRGEAHLTIIDPKEFRKLSKKFPEINHRTFRLSTKGLTCIGLGIQTDGDNRVYFVVVEWTAAQRFRKALGLEPKDFHITIAFREKDIHFIMGENEEKVAANKGRASLLHGFSANEVVSYFS